MPQKGTLFVHSPHKLLTDLTQPTDTLTYLYTETNEVVSVPNVWYNQPYHYRMEMLLIEADVLWARMNGFIVAARKDEALRCYVQYTHRLAAWRWLKANGDPAYPVAAVQA